MPQLFLSFDFAVFFFPVFTFTALNNVLFIPLNPFHSQFKMFHWASQFYERFTLRPKQHDSVLPRYPVLTIQGIKNTLPPHVLLVHSAHGPPKKTLEHVTFPSPLPLTQLGVLLMSFRNVSSILKLFVITFSLTVCFLGFNHRSLIITLHFPGTGSSTET